MLDKKLRTKEMILTEVVDKYGEHLEMLPPEQMTIAIMEIVITMLERERSQNEYYKRLLCRS